MDTTKNSQASADGGSVQRLVRLYPESMEWIVETSHGVYTERGWEFAMRADSKEDAIRICEGWQWDRMRAYNNHTGETIHQPNAKPTDRQ